MKTRFEGNLIIPNVSTPEGAKHAIRYGIIVSVILAVISIGKGINATDSDYLQIACFFGIVHGLVAFGIYKKQYWVAVFGLWFFALPRIFIMILSFSREDPDAYFFIIIWSITIGIYINAMRGIKAYKKGQLSENRYYTNY